MNRHKKKYYDYICRIDEYYPMTGEKKYSYYYGHFVLAERVDPTGYYRQGLPAYGSTNGQIYGVWFNAYDKRRYFFDKYLTLKKCFEHLIFLYNKLYVSQKYLIEQSNFLISEIDEYYYKCCYRLCNINGIHYNIKPSGILKKINEFKKYVNESIKKAKKDAANIKRRKREKEKMQNQLKLVRKLDNNDTKRFFQTIKAISQIED